jgi:hypothetical protein
MLRARLVRHGTARQCVHPRLIALATGAQPGKNARVRMYVDETITLKSAIGVT